MPQDHEHVPLAYIRKTLCLLICALCAFCASHKQKKQIIEKHCLLGKSNPFYFSHTFFFDHYNPLFV